MSVDTIVCRNCGMKKHRIYVEDAHGLDAETLNREDNTAKCCTRPWYEWVTKVT